MATFYVTTDPDKAGRKFQAKDIDAAREKVRRLSDQTGREHFLYYPKKKTGLSSWFRWNPHTEATQEVPQPAVSTVREILEEVYTPTSTRTEMAEAIGEALDLLDDEPDEEERPSRRTRR